MSENKMMSKRNITILSVAMILLCLVAVMLIFMLNEAHEGFEDDVTVTVNEVTTSSVPVRNLYLLPGDKKEYKVNVLCDASGHYNLYLDYEEEHNGGMKYFVNVEIWCEGIDEVVYEGSLTDLLDGEEIITLDGDLNSRDPLEIKIYYEMPLTTGNEAKGTSSDFNINLSIKKS